MHVLSNFRASNMHQSIHTQFLNTAVAVKIKTINQV